MAELSTLTEEEFCMCLHNFCEYYKCIQSAGDFLEGYDYYTYCSLHHCFYYYIIILFLLAKLCMSEVTNKSFHSLFSLLNSVRVSQFLY